MSKDHIIQNLGMVAIVVGMMYGITIIMDMVRDVDGLIAQVSKLEVGIDYLKSKHNE